MQATFGFLLQSGTFTAEVPDGVDTAFEQASSAGLNPGSPTALQCAPKSHLDFAALGWSNPVGVPGATQDLQIYRGDDPTAVWPVWDLGTHYAWVQLTGHTSGPPAEFVTRFVDGLAFEIDARGIPRASLSNGLARGNPYTFNLSRDHVFYELEGRLLTFRYDGSLGVGRNGRDGDTALVTVTTSLGISVVHDGPLGLKDELLSIANEAAASLEQVA
jgi:hypothetical protein